MIEVEIVKCLHSHNGNLRHFNCKEDDPKDFEKGKYYLCIKSARYNLPYVYKEQQIKSSREHCFIERKCGMPIRFEHVQFLRFANKKELKKFKKKYFENRDILLEIGKYENILQ